jgi:hypothetical protein
MKRRHLGFTGFKLAPSGWKTIFDGLGLKKGSFAAEQLKRKREVWKAFEGFLP